MRYLLGWMKENENSKIRCSIFDAREDGEVVN